MYNTNKLKTKQEFPLQFKLINNSLNTENSLNNNRYLGYIRMDRQVTMDTSNLYNRRSIVRLDQNSLYREQINKSVNLPLVNQGANSFDLSPRVMENISQNLNKQVVEKFKPEEAKVQEEPVFGTEFDSTYLSIWIYLIAILCGVLCYFYFFYFNKINIQSFFYN